MVDQVLAAFAKLLLDPLRVGGAHARQVLYPAPRQPAGDSWADLPDVGDRVMEPNLALEGLLVEDADAVGRFLRLDVEGHLRQKEVRAYARRCGDARFLHYFRPEKFGKLPWRHVIQAKVRRRVDEALVDAVHVHVIRGYVSHVDRVNLSRDPHIPPHPRRRHGVLDASGNLEHAAAVLDPKDLHRWRYGQTYCARPPVGVGHHQVLEEGVEPAVGTLDAGIEALQVDAQVALLLALRNHSRPPPTRRNHNLFACFYTNSCSSINAWTTE